VNENELQYNLSAYIPPAVSVTATASATGGFLSGVSFDHWDVLAENLTVSGLDSTAIDMRPLNGNGGEYEPAELDPAEAMVTVRVDADGDYVYLAYTEYQFDEWPPTIVYHSGKEISMSLMYWPYLVYDGSRGTFNGSSESVHITVTGGGKSTTIPVVLTKEVTCARVTFEPSRLTTGQRATLRFEKENEDGTFSEFPADQEFDVMILGGGDNTGTLESPSGSGTTLARTLAPVTYVAPTTIEADSMIVRVVALAYGSNGGSGSEIAANKAATLIKKVSKSATAASATKQMRDSAVAKFAGLLAVNECTPAEAVVKKGRTPKKIELQVSAPEVSGPGIVTLTVVLSDGAGKIKPGETDAKVDFILGYEAQNFGSLKGNDDIGSGMTLPNVSYDAARNGSVVITFNKESYDGIFPLRIKIRATVVNNAALNADVVVSLVGPHTIGKYYSQSDSDWAGLEYDSSGGTIGDLGCALSGMAMVLQATGVNVNPKILNDFMNNHHGYDFVRHGVRWNAVITYVGMKNSKLLPAEVVPIDGEGLTGRNGVLVGTPQPDAILNQYVTGGYLVLAQVKNVHKDGTTSRHWVVVTDRTGTDPIKGDELYSILDPGNSRRTTLLDYSNEVYRLVAFKLKH
jgi:hypothetical protein